MKIRTDFVTNSSSSSFIIGKREDTSVTVESVWQLIKQFYNEMYAKVESFKNYMQTAENTGYKLTVNKYYNIDIIGNGNLTREEHIQYQKQLEEQFGLSEYGTYPVNRYEWLECETYADYKKYWLFKIGDTEEMEETIPFVLIDYTEDIDDELITFLKKDTWYSSEYSHGVDSDVLHWYFCPIEQAFDDVDECAVCKYPCEDKGCGALLCKRIKEEGITKDNVCLYLLGRIAVLSECGKIDDYVVEKLIDVAEHACNHMG